MVAPIGTLLLSALDQPWGPGGAAVQAGLYASLSPPSSRACPPSWPCDSPHPPPPPLRPQHLHLWVESGLGLTRAGTRGCREGVSLWENPDSSPKCSSGPLPRLPTLLSAYRGPAPTPEATRGTLRPGTVREAQRGQSPCPGQGAKGKPQRLSPRAARELGTAALRAMPAAWAVVEALDFFVPMEGCVGWDLMKPPSVAECGVDGGSLLTRAEQPLCPDLPPPPRLTSPKIRAVHSTLSVSPSDRRAS